MRRASSVCISRMLGTGAGFFSYVIEGGSSSTGLWSAFSLDGDGNKHIAYYNSSSYSMDYAKSIGNLWQTQSVDGGAASSSGMRHMSIVTGPDNLPHISYVEESLDIVKYAHFDGSSWNITHVETRRCIQQRRRIRYLDRTELIGTPRIAALNYWGRRGLRCEIRQLQCLWSIDTMCPNSTTHGVLWTVL